MYQLANISVGLICITAILIVGCGGPAARDEQSAETKPLAWRDRVAGILQPGWEVVQVDSSIVITRKEPVTYYNPIALPGRGDMLAKMIEQSRHTEKYQITLDVVDRLSNEKYEELKAINAKTEKELQAREERMRSFASKGYYSLRLLEMRFSLKIIRAIW